MSKWNDKTEVIGFGTSNQLRHLNVDSLKFGQDSFSRAATMQNVRLSWLPD